MIVYVAMVGAFLGHDDDETVGVYDMEEAAREAAREAAEARGKECYWVETTTYHGSKR